MSRCASAPSDRTGRRSLGWIWAAWDIGVHRSRPSREPVPNAPAYALRDRETPTRQRGRRLDMRKTLIAALAADRARRPRRAAAGDDEVSTGDRRRRRHVDRRAVHREQRGRPDRRRPVRGDDPGSRRSRPTASPRRRRRSITIENQDTVTHTFTIDGTQVDVVDRRRSDVQRGRPPDSSPGTYAFHCTIHSAMTGTVIVS